MNEQITKDMTFHQILQRYPQAGKVLEKFNLGCVGCLGAMSESLAQGVKAHGLNVDEVLQALNDSLTD